MKPWAIYIRVSTEDQASGVSLDAQLTACRAYAIARSWTVGPEISDPGASAGTLKRPGMQQVLAAMRAGEVAGVISWRLDRLTRSVRDLLTLLDLTTELDVGIVSVTESLDTTTPMGRFVVHLLGAIAQWERETIGARVKNAMAHARTQGYWLGHVIPAGCQVIADGKRKRLARGDQADDVAKAWGWVLAGASLREVVERFKEGGIRPSHHVGLASRTGWTPTTVRNLLLSMHTVGVLVDPATHNLVRQALAARSNPHRRGADADPGARAAAPSILAGLLRCPTCGAACVQVTGSGNGGTYRYFRCTARVKGLCGQKDLRCEPIEGKALEAVAGAVQPGGDYFQKVRARRERAGAALGDNRAERLRLTSERDQLTARVSELVLRSQIGTAVWEAGMKALGSEMERVDKRLAELAGAIAVGEVDQDSLDLVLAEISSGGARLASAPAEEQRRSLRSLVSAVRIEGDEVVLDLYDPGDLGGGSSIDPKKRTRLHGQRTIRVRVRLASGSGPSGRCVDRRAGPSSG